MCPRQLFVSPGGLELLSGREGFDLTTSHWLGNNVSYTLDTDVRSAWFYREADHYHRSRAEMAVYDADKLCLSSPLVVAGRLEPVPAHHYIRREVACTRGVKIYRYSNIS